MESEEKMELRKNNKRNLYLLAIIALAVVMVVPVFELARYNHPSADDFNYAVTTYHIWKQTHSVGDVLRAAVETSANFWKSWQGLYSSAFVLALQPAIFGEKYYVLTGYFMTAIIYVSNIFFCYFILCKKFKADKIEGAAFGSMLSFLMLQWIPSPVEGIFWFNGAMNYVLFYGILLLLIAVAVNLSDNKSNRRYAVKLIVGVILSIVLAGGNHVTAFMGILFLLGSSIVSVVMKNKRMLIGNVLFLVCIIAGFIFNVSSPGTKVRQSYFTERPGIAGTIKLAIESGVNYVKSWTGLYLVISMLLMLPVVISIVKKIIKEYQFKFRYPIVIFVASVGWICVMLCPPIYAMGVPGAGRLTNVVYFFFILLAFINLFYICGWIITKIYDKKGKEEDGYFAKGWMITAIVLTLGLGIACGKDTLSYKAFVSLKDGTAQEYSREAYERYELLMNSKGKDVVVSSYYQTPPLLFFDDITEDKTDWRNMSVTQFYELKSIRKQ